MDSNSAEKGVVSEQNEKELPAYVSMVDPFLVEALQNPRHRLTILRMELDVQNFLQNPNLQQFEFPHFPTSYLRLAAHRVAQHYGLVTMVHDNPIDGQGIRILVLKKPESKFPAIYLSDVPAKESENEKLDQIKLVIRPRASQSSVNDSNELGLKRNLVRTVEERKEDYDRARARIFSSSSGYESEEVNTNFDENEYSRNLSVDGSASRVAILRDREKDRTDPDYDRSYERYVRNLPSTQNFSIAPYNIPKFQPPFVQYNSTFPQPNHMPAPQASINYNNPYCSIGLNQSPGNALYMQWPTQSMMYAHSYNQIRQAVFQAPFCQQQPLSFDYSQNHL